MPDANDPDKKSPHTLADHLHGRDVHHSHGDGASDHDHDDDFAHEPPLAQQITLTSIGVDIGSAGTQAIFCRVQMQRSGEAPSGRYLAVSRETLYQSPIALTPYLNEARIDERAIGDFIDEAYAAAGLHPDAIDIGAVILTGEALRRENARAISETLAERCGEFVCATAGHHMEAMLAAYGSGAAKLSHDNDLRILNVDIGGGSTKLALIRGGKIIETAALHIGGRLIVVDDENRITRLDPGGRQLAHQAGFEWNLGDATTEASLDALGEWMADALVTAVLERPSPAPIEALYLTDPLQDLGEIDGVMFSGGVGEYVYGRESRDFGDLGRRLGVALRRRVDDGRLPWRLLPARECIRATAVGASEYNVQLSGNTVYISSPGDLLPRKNLPVLQPQIDLAGEIDADALAAAIADRFKAFDLIEGESEVALAFRWRGEPSFERLSAFARGVTISLGRTIDREKPIYLVFDKDVARTVGALLKDEQRLAGDLLALDGIALRDFDYIDLGRIRMPSGTVPVTIKSLVFSHDPRAPHRHAHRPHGHGHSNSHFPSDSRRG